MFDCESAEWWYCSSAESFRTVARSQSDESKRYEVRLDRQSHKYTDEKSLDWSCTCPAYEYQCGPHRKHRYCKHIKKAQDSDAFCGWQQMRDGDTPEFDENATAHCPECGRQAKTSTNGAPQ